jgi:protein TonB
MKQFIVILTLLFNTSIIIAQENADTLSVDSDSTTFTIVEKIPIFPGGESEMYKFLGEHMSYPEKARDKNVQGRVYVSFIVEKDGSISSIKVLRGIGSGCDKEAIRVVKSMPKWTPGYQKGKAVRVRYNLPILFKLTKTGKKNKKNAETLPEY